MAQKNLNVAAYEFNVQKEFARKHKRLFETYTSI